MATHAIVAPWAFHRSGGAGLWAASLAMAVCFAGAVVGFLWSGWLRSPRQILPALWLGLFARMGAPLLCGILIHLHGGPLVWAGFLYYLLVYYMVALATSTALLLLLVGQTRQRSS